MWPDVWRILVVCILHNQTKRKQVDEVYQQLFDKYPTAEIMSTACQRELAFLIKPLGFQNRRSLTLIKFSIDYMTKDWDSPRELYGCVKYADDCYRVFCLGDWANVKSTDGSLNHYLQWLREQYKMENHDA